MSSNEIAIQVKNLGKCFHVYKNSQDRLKQLLFGWRKQYYKEFWALKDISFEIKKGETFGIIGINGSGKSTLLQLICNVLTPTQGQIEIKGRVAALLELGAGFNPEFTGRENVFLNGAILGFTSQQMSERFDEIAEFADIGDFIDQPVKTYSSGMFVRLAFAVQACVEPDVLIVDEALAVGDIFFRQKCYKRLNELRDKGASIVLVSHAMSDVEEFCQRAILLSHGEILAMGPSTEVVKQYYMLEQQHRLKNNPSATKNPIEQPPTNTYVANEHSIARPPADAFLNLVDAAQVSNGTVRCTGVAVCNSQGQASLVFEQGEVVSFFYEFELSQDIEVPVGGLEIRNEKGVIVHGKQTLQYMGDFPLSGRRGSRIVCRQDVALEIAVGEYTFTVGVAMLSSHDYQQRGVYPHSELATKFIRLCELPSLGKFAVTFRNNAKPLQLLHYGAANLPGTGWVVVDEPA